MCISLVSPIFCSFIISLIINVQVYNQLYFLYFFSKELISSVALKSIDKANI